jgi:hypothetical protein
MNAEALIKHLGIDKEHKGKIEEVTKYIEDHRVQELFNVSASEGYTHKNLCLGDLRLLIVTQYFRSC